MKKVDEEKEGLLDEIAHLKERIASLEKTESKSNEIEKTLQESEERYKVIMQGAASCIAIYKPVDDGQNFIFVDFNPMAEKADKILKDKVIGKKVTEVFPGIIEFGLLDVFRNVWKTGKMEHFPASIYKDDRFQGFRDNYVYKLPSGGIIAVYQDLTSRKQEKESLLESEEKFKELADMLPLVVFETDINGNLTFANKQAFENFGYTREMFTNGMNVMQTMLQEDRERAKENILNILKGNKLGSIEYTALKADGTAVPVITYSIPIMKNDQPVGMRGILIDITERKKAEEDLRKSETRFAQIAESAGEWIWEIDTEGKYTYSNSVVENILGYKPDEIVNRKHFYDFFPPDVRDDLKKGAFNAFSKKEVIKNLENPNVHKDGRIIILDTCGVPILDENSNLLGYRGTDTNITDRKRAEETIKESEEKYRSLVESLEEGIGYVDTNETFIYANKASANIFGCSLDDMIGKNLKEFTSPASFQQVLNETALRKEGKSSRFELEILRKNGEHRIITVTSTPIISETGELQGSLGIFHDITEHKQADEELKKYQDHLEELVKERTQTLERQKEDLLSMNKVFVGREFRIKELRDEVAKLKGFHSDEK